MTWVAGLGVAVEGEVHAGEVPGVHPGAEAVRDAAARRHLGKHGTRTTVKTLENTANIFDYTGTVKFAQPKL